MEPPYVGCYDSSDSRADTAFRSEQKSLCESAKKRYNAPDMSKLLLIDDEEDVLYSLRRIFDSPELELATAASGEEGLKTIPKFKPDLVLMDVRMGGLSGLETLTAPPRRPSRR